jgi:hypothetical protein
MNNTIRQLAIIMQMHPNDERRRHDLAERVALELPELVREMPPEALEIVQEWLVANGCPVTQEVSKRAWLEIVREWMQGERNPRELVRELVWRAMGFRA